MEIITAIISNLDIISVVCFIIGFGLVIIEMFVPGFGAPGISGSVLLIVAIVLTANTVLEAFILIIMVLIILGILLTIILKSANKGGVARGVILSTSMTRDKGYVGVGTEDMDYFLGKEGLALTMLRPAGSVDFDGVKLDALTDGEYIQKGSKVKVIKVKGRRLVVRKIDK
ncbi:NfeD family protein [Sporosalibacterium faouarense]|uniref:NfeD family protein n=1 Tax=Sporosalibacterium faouarense TaxID=516123 RepID=UPI00192C4D37|nr:NfeD family protein [Sporosalibacterium faouarense]